MLKVFEKEGKRYLANLEKGLVVRIDDVVASLLDLKGQPIWSLEERFSPFQILEGVRKLKALQNLGVISPKISEISHTNEEGDLPSLFVSPWFPYELHNLSFVSRVDVYSLLRALAKRSSLFLALSGDEGEFSSDFNVDSIHRVNPPKSPFLSSVRSIPRKCKGILTFSNLSFKELVFLKGTKLPVVNFIKADEQVREGVIRSAARIASFIRRYDALICDSSWARNALLKRVPDLENLYVIPGGIEFDLFRPLPKSKAKEVISKAFGNPLLLSRRIILLFTGGFSPQEKKSFLKSLSSEEGELSFIVVDNKLEIELKGNNIEWYQVKDLEDFEALPFIFSATDVGFFPADIGVAPTYILSAMACGVPMVVAGEDIPEEVERGGILLRSNREVSTRVLLEMIRGLIKREERLDELSWEAQKQVEHLTWELAAKKILNLSSELQEKLKEAESLQRSSFRFFRYYDKGKEETRTKVIRLPDGYELPVEKALAETLLAYHTEKEVKTILEYLKKLNPKEEGGEWGCRS